MNEQVIGVKEFLEIVNETLAFAYPTVTVEGEVSGFKVNQGKWVFFDLKEEDALLHCFIPLFQLKVPLEDGMRVQVSGVPKIFIRRSEFSLTAKTIILSGEGELKRAFEILKEKLGAEGLFSPERKRPLPEFPRRIGLITSLGSAAFQDFIKILNHRFGGLEVLAVDVSVQGQSAPDQIEGAFRYFNQLAEPTDVVVLIRGGGSLEDLAAFNSEQVARAVASSRTPTIVGVGHEIDTTLADMAADLRAATPTDAARLVVPDKSDVARRVSALEAELGHCLRRQLVESSRKTDRHLSVLERFMSLPASRVDSVQGRLLRASQLALNRQSERLESIRRLLRSFDPTSTLKRGYAIVTHEGRVLKTSASVSSGDKLVIKLSEGKLDSTVD